MVVTVRICYNLLIMAFRTHDGHTPSGDHAADIVALNTRRERNGELLATSLGIERLGVLQSPVLPVWLRPHGGLAAGLVAAHPLWEDVVVRPRVIKDNTQVIGYAFFPAVSDVQRVIRGIISADELAQAIQTVFDVEVMPASHRPMVQLVTVVLDPRYDVYAPSDDGASGFFSVLMLQEKYASADVIATLRADMFAGVADIYRVRDIASHKDD